MITIAYHDWRRVDEDTWEFRVPKAYDPRNRYVVEFLLTNIVLLNPHLFRIRTIDEVMAEGCPFVFPVDLTSEYTNFLSVGDTQNFLPYVMPRSVIDAARAGRAVILVNYAGEGNRMTFTRGASQQTMSTYDVLQEFVERYDLPDTAVWFLNGNLAADREFAAWRRLRLGSADAPPPFVMCTTDLLFYLMQSMQRAVAGGRFNDMQVRWATNTPEPYHVTTYELLRLDGEAANQFEKQARDPAAPPPSKLFLCMNRTLKRHRREVVCRLQAMGLLDECLISFDDPSPGDTRFDDPVLQTAWEMVAAKAPFTIDREAGSLWQRYDSSSSAHYRHFALAWLPNAWPYHDTLLSIVNESNYESDTTFVTEKTLKAIVHEHPFIIVGSPGSLAWLRRMGFRTFEPYIDETYDTIEDGDARMASAMASVRSVAALSAEDRVRLFHQLRPIAEHNRRHLHEMKTIMERQMEAIEAQLLRPALSTRLGFPALG